MFLHKSILRISSIILLFYCHNPNLFGEQDNTFTSFLRYADSVLAKMPETPSKVDSLIEFASFVDKGNPKQGIAYATQALAMARKLKYRKGEAIALAELGGAMIFNSQINEAALAFLDSALSIAHSLQDSFTLGFAYRKKGNYFFYQGSSADSTKSYFEKSYLYFEGVDDKEWSSSVKNFATISMNLGDYKTAYSLLSGIKPFLEKEKDYATLGTTYNDLATLAYYEGNFDLAIHLCDSARILAETHSLASVMAKTLMVKGTVHMEQGMYRQSMEALLASRDYYLQAGDERGYIQTCNILSELNGTFGYSKEQIKYIQEGIAMAQKVKFEKQAGLGHHFLSLAFLKQSQIDSALFYAVQASHLLKNDTSDRAYFIESTLLEAKIHLKRNNFEYAATKCREIEPFLADFGNLEDKVSYHQILGNIQLGQNLPNIALVNLENAYQLSQEAGINLRVEVMTDLSKAYASVGKYYAAYTLHDLAATLKDSILNHQNAQALSQMQTLYETEKKDRELHEKNETIYKKEKTISRMIAIGSSVGAALLLALVLVLLNRNMLKEKANRQLAASKKEVEEINVQLKEYNGVLEQFAFIAVHDLKEPLRSINGFSTLIQQKYINKLLDQNANKYLDYIIKGSIRLNEYINDLYNYMRTYREGGLEKELVDTELVIQDILEEKQEEMVEIGASLEIKGPLPNIMGSGSLVKQIFKNLIGNSIKFRGAAPLKIEISGEKRGDKYVFKVQDNGIGIAKEHHGKIFEIFKKLENKSKNAGSGMGLAICKKIVQQYGGEIWVESEPNQGCSFYFTIKSEEAAPVEFV